MDCQSIIRACDVVKGRIATSPQIVKHPCNPHHRGRGVGSALLLTQSLDPMHLSMTSDGMRCDGLGGPCPFLGAVNMPTDPNVAAAQSAGKGG